MFVAMGLSAVLPVLHGLQIYGYQELEQRMGLSWVVAQGVLYITGAGLYAVSHYLRYSVAVADSPQARIPERFAPGRFDVSTFDPRGDIVQDSG